MNMNIELLHPRHMPKPGDDGYRTPTIEDAENLFAVQRNKNSLIPSAGVWARQAHSSALEALHSNSCRKPEGDAVADVNGVHPHNDSDYSAVSLSWKQRIRHFTWAFFTLTMATGGIANVLHASKFGHVFGLGLWFCLPN